MNTGKELTVISFGGREINKSKRLQFMKSTNWNLLHIVRGISISGAPTLNTVTNKSEKTGYKSEKIRGTKPL